jgi:hypothetical protein
VHAGIRDYGRLTPRSDDGVLVFIDGIDGAEHQNPGEDTNRHQTHDAHNLRDTIISGGITIHMNYSPFGLYFMVLFRG